MVCATQVWAGRHACSASTNTQQVRSSEMSELHRIKEYEGDPTEPLRLVHKTGNKMETATFSAQFPVLACSGRHQRIKDEGVAGSVQAGLQIHTHLKQSESVCCFVSV